MIDATSGFILEQISTASKKKSKLLIALEATKNGKLNVLKYFGDLMH